MKAKTHICKGCKRQLYFVSSLSNKSSNSIVMSLLYCVLSTMHEMKYKLLIHFDVQIWGFWGPKKHNISSIPKALLSIYYSTQLLMFSEVTPLMIIITHVAFIINREKFSASKSLLALLQVLISKQSWILAFGSWALRGFTSKRSLFLQN